MSIRKNIDITLNLETINGSVVFDTLDEYRLVNPKQTTAVIILLQKYLDKNNIKNFDLNVLIPENIGKISNNLRYSQFLVKDNYLLLGANKLLTYDEALFLLLGLNTRALHENLPKEFTLYKKNPGINSFEYAFCTTLQNKELSKSMFLNPDGSITSNNLNILANNCNFFTKQDQRISKRSLDEGILRNLHSILKRHKFIKGEFESVWIWKTHRNKLAYLSKELKKRKVIAKGNCHIELSYYIEDPSGTEVKKSLSDHSDTDISKKSKEIINEIINEAIQ